jgi:hypothetical protein
LTTPISPKVTAGANWSFIAALVVSFLNSITPDMLAPLGKWTPLVYMLVSGAAFALGAYLKTDPLRVPAKDATGGDTPSAPQPAPATASPAPASSDPAPSVEVTPIVPA